MKTSSLRGLSVEELRQKEQELRKEAFHLRFQQATGEIENPNRVKAVRRDIARVLTILTEMTAGKNG